MKKLIVVSIMGSVWLQLCDSRNSWAGKFSVENAQRGSELRQSPSSVEGVTQKEDVDFDVQCHTYYPLIPEENLIFQQAKRNFVKAFQTDSSHLMMETLSILSLSQINCGAIENHSGLNLLQIAAKNGMPQIVKALSRTDLLFRPDRDGQTALHWAVKSNHPEVVNLLLHPGVMTVKDLRGATAFHLAAELGNPEIIRLFIGKPGFEMMDTRGRTALQIAAGTGRVDAVRLLMETPLIDTLGGDASTALHMAAYRGHTEIVDLLKATQLLEMRTLPDGNTALHIAAYNDQANVIRRLLNTSLLKKVNRNGYTALHLAAQRGKLRAVRELMNTELLDARIEKGYTALHLAARAGQKEVVELLMKTQAAEMRADKGLTALHVAAQAGQREVVESLVKTPLLEMQADDGYTALHLAVHFRQKGVIQVLMKTPLLRTRDQNGLTPLLWALKNQDSPLALLLLSESPRQDLETVSLPLKIKLGEAGVLSFPEGTQLLEIAQQINASDGAEKRLQPFIEMVTALRLFRQRDAVGLRKHLQNHLKVDLKLFAAQLAETPYDSQELNQFRAQLIEQESVIRSDFQVAQNCQAIDQAMDLGKEFDLGSDDCASAELMHQISQIVQERILGKSVKDYCIRALGKGFKNKGKVYTSAYAEIQKVNPTNSFPTVDCYIQNQRSLLSRIAPSAQGDKPMTQEIWEGLSPADREFAQNPEEFVRRVIPEVVSHYSE